MIEEKAKRILTYIQTNTMLSQCCTKEADIFKVSFFSHEKCPKKGANHSLFLLPQTNSLLTFKSIKGLLVKRAIF